jgi:hypothetical protein
MLSHCCLNGLSNLAENKANRYLELSEPREEVSLRKITSLCQVTVEYFSRTIAEGTPQTIIYGVLKDLVQLNRSLKQIQCILRLTSGGLKRTVTNNSKCG